MERRGLILSKNILWVTDGGGGIIKALKDRFGTFIKIAIFRNTWQGSTGKRHTDILE